MHHPCFLENRIHLDLQDKATNLMKEYKLSRLKSRSIMKMALFQKAYSLTTSYVQIKYFKP
jgi:hypothetical protein